MENLSADTNGLPIQYQRQPKILRIAGQFISIVFHPLFIPLYVTAFLLYIHPIMFSGIPDQLKVRILASVGVNLTILPAFTVFILWKLKFADNIYLRTQKERLIPYAAVMFFSFWCWYVFRNISQTPDLFVQFLLGTFIAVIAAWMANIYFKVSMHGLGVGGMLYFITAISLNHDGGSGLFIAAALLVTGLVLTARLLVSDHKPFEVYAGLMLGIFAQYLAGFF